MTVTQEQVMQFWLERVEPTIDKKLKEEWSPGKGVYLSEEELGAAPSKELATALQEHYPGITVKFVHPHWNMYTTARISFI